MAVLDHEGKALPGAVEALGQKNNGVIPASPPPLAPLASMLDSNPLDAFQLPITPDDIVRPAAFLGASDLASHSV